MTRQSLPQSQAPVSSGRRCRGQRGTALVEFSLVAGLLMYFIYGIAAFGLILAQKNSITQAATEGARSALSVPGVASPTEAQRTAQAVATVADTLSWMGAKYQPSDTTVAINGCSSPSDTARCITVTITYPYAARPLLPQAPGLGFVTPNQIKASAVLRIS